MIDVSCFTMLVTECDGVSDCAASNAPIDSNWSFTLDTVGSTFENWTHWTLDGSTSSLDGSTDICFCYWLYMTCWTEPTTEPTFVPTMNPSNPTRAPSEAPTPFGADVLAAQATNFFVENLVIFIAIFSGIFVFLVVCCALCITRRRKWRAEELRKETELSQRQKSRTGTMSRSNGQQTEMGDLEGPRAMTAAPSYVQLDDEKYAVKFHKRPFGMHLGKTKVDQKNVYITRNDPDSEAERGGVKPHSVIVQIGSEEVEDLGAVAIGKIFKIQSRMLPITIVFRPGTADEVGLDAAMMQIPSALSNKKPGDVPQIQSVPTNEDEEELEEAAESAVAEKAQEDDEMSLDDAPVPDVEADTAAADEEYEYEEDDEYEYYEEQVTAVRNMDTKDMEAVEAAFEEAEDEHHD